MGLRLYNTLTRRVEPFETLEPGRVGAYACGPTIYGHAHIGNFRTFLVFDLVHRYLEWRGYQVRFVMNLTDVDDKTIAAAAREGTTIRGYTEPYAEAVLRESDALGIRRFDAYPRATEYVSPMVELVERLLERGMAYTTDDGSVFFDISAFPDYGKLSRIDPEQVRPGERVASDEYGKEDVRDFALWKAAKEEDERTGAVWDAPWGRGRPGWHLECSAMGITEVGETLDLHLGGEDLVFPHHEDEIAQSEGATGKPFVRYWLHVKHLLVEGRKMSKSLGNMITVRELLERGEDPAAIRHQLLSAQYRRELNFTQDGLEGSGRAVQRLLDFEDRLRALHPAAGDGSASADGGAAGDEAAAGKAATGDEAAAGDEAGGGHPTGAEEEVGVGGGGPASGGGPGGPGLAERADRALAEFREAMDDDLNVAEAMAALFVFVNEGNAHLDRVGGRVPVEEGNRALEAVSSMDEVLGILEVARTSRAVDAETRVWIEQRVREREQARARGEYQTADRIRDELRERGVVLEDSPRGTRWKLGGAGVGAT